MCRYLGVDCIIFRNVHETLRCFPEVCAFDQSSLVIFLSAEDFSFVKPFFNRFILFQQILVPFLEAEDSFNLLHTLDIQLFLALDIADFSFFKKIQLSFPLMS